MKFDQNCFYILVTLKFKSKKFDIDDKLSQNYA